MLDDRYAVIDDVMERIVNEQETKLAAEEAGLDEADIPQAGWRVPTTAGSLAALAAVRRHTGLAAVSMGIR